MFEDEIDKYLTDQTGTVVKDVFKELDDIGRSEYNDELSTLLDLDELNIDPSNAVLHIINVAKVNIKYLFLKLGYTLDEDYMSVPIESLFKVYSNISIIANPPIDLAPSIIDVIEESISDGAVNIYTILNIINRIDDTHNIDVYMLVLKDVSKLTIYNILDNVSNMILSNELVTEDSHDYDFDLINKLSSVLESVNVKSSTKLMMDVVSDIGTYNRVIKNGHTSLRSLIAKITLYTRELEEEEEILCKIKPLLLDYILICIILKYSKSEIVLSLTPILDTAYTDELNTMLTNYLSVSSVDVYINKILERINDV